MATNITTNSSKQQQRNRNEEHSFEQAKSSTSSTASNPTKQKFQRTAGDIVVYDVEHLATFSTTGSHETSSKATSDNDDDTRTKLDPRNSGSIDEPKVALQRLFELEKLSGIWTQHMQIELRDEFMLIVDCETDAVVERFNRDCVVKPEAFNQYNDIYNNIVVFTIQSATQGKPRLDKSGAKKATNDISEKESDRRAVAGAKSDKQSESNLGTEGELHIFQCVSHEAQQLVADILSWKLRPAGTQSNQAMASASSNEASLSTTNGSSSSSSFSKSSNRTFDEPHNKSDPLTSNTTTNKSSQAPATTSSASRSSPSAKPVVTVASSSSTSENVPIVNVNVKETVQVFNQIAALREKSSKPTSPTNHTNRPSSDASVTSSQSTPAADSTTATNGPESSRLSANAGGGHLYKQRSIRATLAPKYISGDGSPTGSHQTTKPDSQVGSSNSAGSIVSSSDAATKSALLTAPMQHNQSGSGHGPVGNSSSSSSSNNHHEADYYMKQQVAGSTSNGVLHGSSVHHSSQQVAGAGQHRSSKSRSQPPPQQQRTQSDSSRSHVSSTSTSQIDQVTTNESYVSVLNHCFDDIEKFIIRIQQSATASRELLAKRKLSKRSNPINGGSKDLVYNKNGNPPVTASELAMLSARARGPNEDDYFEILSKFKLAFNLLAKLKGCIHEPNAPELVHFLFTPLAIIIESARNVSPPIDPTIVGIPYLNQDALDLLSNCCTSKESDMWLSLGPNWTQTIDPNVLKASRLPSSFQPIFSDGWAPVINELELIGLVAPPLNDRAVAINASDNHHRGHHEPSSRRHPPYIVDETPIGFPVDGSPYSVGVSNGRPKSNASKNYKKKGSPSPPYGRHGELIEQPYFNPMPHGYSHETGPDGSNIEQGDSYRMSGHSSARTSRLEPLDDQLVGRRGKHNSRRAADYPSAIMHGVPHYAINPLRPGEEEIDYIGYPNGRLAYSDDYTELHDQYMDDPKHSKAGPSGHHHRKDKAHGHARYSQRGAWQANQGELFEQHHASHSYDVDNLSEVDREAMLLDLGPAQTEWFFELQSRGAMIVRVLFTREANNDKELSVRRGEILEILDDSRKWWRARNINLQVAHVPHTIVAIMHGYQTIDELLTNNPVSLGNEDPSFLSAQRLHRRDLQHVNYLQHQCYDDKRNSSAAGAFRYF